MGVLLVGLIVDAIITVFKSMDNEYYADRKSMDNEYYADRKYITVYDDDGDPVPVLKEDIKDVTDWGAVYTRKGRRYFYRGSMKDFKHSLYRS